MNLNRRQWLRGAAGLLLARGCQAQEMNATTPPLLDEVERRACRYFWEQADPHTGLVRDRARMEGRDNRRAASIAATGFGLSALCVADRRSYLPAQEIRTRAQRTLGWLAHTASHEHGFFYHFMDVSTGERIWHCELSSIDTAWLLCGVLHAKAHFDTPAIRDLAAQVLDRVDWPWMLNGSSTLSHGWTPESGFLPYRWDTYSELLAMYLLAVGSATHPIPVSSWDAWSRPMRSFGGLSFIGGEAPLFAHQYSHAWFDFRDRQDRYADYFDNSRLATEAHRLFCMQLSPRYPWYGKDMWGVTASDSRRGYVAWGEPNLATKPDGTLVPCAAGGSVAFLPGECAGVLDNMLKRYGNRVWGQYGFVDAFHPQDNWYSPDVIGIDQGIMLLMAENLRSQSVWEAVMSTPEAGRAMAAVGLARRAAQA